MNTRNMDIKSALATKNRPMLPFERDLLYEQFNHCINKQSALAKSLGEAMRQSSETWHDNAPADVVSSDSKVLADRAEMISENLRLGLVFDYVDDCEEVTLGSVCTVQYSPGDEMSVILVGVTRDLPEDIETQLPDGCVAVTLESPLGAAMLGASSGSEVLFLVVGGKKTTVKILDIKSVL